VPSLRAGQKSNQRFVPTGRNSSPQLVDGI
jgi:hypothetical protein